MAKPRVFVSSTYYDLKYVRERLERFISAYCFDPILFESDEVFFNPNISLDESCYKEVENCHMMILIVGGRYGSLASEQKEKYEKQYISITRKEYETARQKGIPIMVFVEQNVFAEYKTYMANQKKMPDGFKYAFVDDARIFEFISNLEQGAIKIFSKIDDIEHYFSYQIAGMLLSYLKDLQEKKSDVEIKNAVDEIKVVSQSMQGMINSIAEKILSGEQGKYKDLLRKQNESLIDFFMELADQNINISNSNDKINEEIISEYAGQICKIIQETLLNKETINNIDRADNPFERFKTINEIIQNCSVRIKSLYKDIDVNINLFRLYKPLTQILEIISSNKNLKEYFDKKLNTIIVSKLSLPF